MTKKLWTLVLCLLCSQLHASTEVVIKSQKKNELKVTWKIDKSEISTTKSKSQGPMVFSDVTLKGWSLTKTVGAPSLPFKSIILEALPKDLKASIDANGVFEMTDIAPTPAQKMPCRCDIVPWKFNIDFDQESYNKGLREHLFVEFLGYFKGRPLTRVRFSPFAYNNMSGLRFISDAKISITSKNKIIKATLSANDQNMIILSPDKFLSVLEPLIKRRQSEGYTVSVYSLDEIGRTFEDVKEFTHKLYKESPFSYSMIIGHEEIFPTEYVSTRFDDNTPSDMHYYTMDGSDDVIPDVLYSRISVDSVSDLENFISKTVEFEQRSWSNSNVSKQMIAIASDEGYDPTDVEYVRQMQQPLKEKFRWQSKEFLQEKDNSTPTNIVNEFNQGAVWLNYIGHGSGFSWPSLYGEDFTTDHISLLKAGAVKPIVIDVACQNGKFNNENRMGESFIRATNGRTPAGAVAYYGGSVDISWDPPAIMAIGAGKALSENNNRRLIDVLWQGQLYLLENYDDRAGALENFVWYHLQGDPLLNLKNLR